MIVRAAWLVMAVYLAASAVVMADDRGLVDHEGTVASTAEAMRGLGSGELTGGLEELSDLIETAREILDSFNELGRALEDAG